MKQDHSTKLYFFLNIKVKGNDDQINDLIKAIQARKDLCYDDGYTISNVNNEVKQIRTEAEFVIDDKDEDYFSDNAYCSEKEFDEFIKSKCKELGLVLCTAAYECSMSYWDYVGPSKDDRSWEQMSSTKAEYWYSAYSEGEVDNG